MVIAVSIPGKPILSAPASLMATVRHETQSSYPLVMLWARLFRGSTNRHNRNSVGKVDLPVYLICLGEWRLTVFPQFAVIYSYNPYFGNFPASVEWCPYPDQVKTNTHGGAQNQKHLMSTRTTLAHPNAQSMNGSNPDRVLVTGAAGFGGSNLTRVLLREGFRVTGLDIVPPGSATLLEREVDHPRFTYLWKSVQDIQPGDIDGHAVVAHLAAQADTPMAFDSPRYAVMQNI